jgi:molybdenum cofactor synthesis domain-containing protein
VTVATAEAPVSAPRQFVALDVAVDRVLAGCTRLAPVVVDRDQALGLVAAHAVTSARSVPPFANSAMDGYAVRSADCAAPGATLEVSGAVMAGQAAGTVRPGTAWRITTGAPLPAGADAVCPWEQAEVLAGSRVRIGPAVPGGRNVRKAGEDVAPGDVLVASGQRIAPVHLGVLASAGVDAVPVVPTPVVGVLSTGDELRTGEGPLSATIGDSNRPTLLGLLRRDGYTTVDLGAACDEPDAYRSALDEASAAGCHVVVSTGGVSFGDRDVVRRVLGEAHCVVHHPMEVAIKPGKPQVFAVLSRPPLTVFGLPGNPVAVFVSWELFVRPGLRTLAGQTPVGRPRLRLRAGRDVERRPDGKVHLVPVGVEPGEPPLAWPRAGVASHMLSALRDADGLALVPDGPGVPAGSELDCIVIEPERVLEAALAP